MDRPSHYPFRSAAARTRYLSAYDKRAEHYWPQAHQTRMIETSYGQTFTRISGEEGSPPLILLPGGNTTSLMWWQQVVPLSSHFRTYAVDAIYDFGRSIPVEEPRTIDQLTHWLNQLLDGLGITGAVNLAGLSYGGWLSALYGLHFPDRVNRLILLAPAATVVPLSPKFLVRAILRLAIPLRFFTRSLIYWICQDLLLRDAAGRAVVEDVVEDFYLAGRCFRLRRMVVPTVLDDDALARLAPPTLFLLGEREKIYPPNKVLSRLQAVAPRIRTELITGAGHDLLFVDGDLMARKMLDFLLEDADGPAGQGMP